MGRRLDNGRKAMKGAAGAGAVITTAKCSTLMADLSGLLARTQGKSVADF